MFPSFGLPSTRLGSIRVGSARLRAVVLPVALALVVLAPAARAQNHGGPGGPGGGMPGGSFGGANSSFGPNNSTSGRNAPPSTASREEPTSTLHGGLQLGPPGRWWDDAKFAKSLGLDTNQQHHMDDIFNASKGNLRNLYEGLLHEESQLEKLTRVRSPDEVQIDQQIDRVTSARNVLEKASAHAMLELRKQMTPEQISRLEDHRGS